MTNGAERFSPLTCILSLIMGEKLMNGEYGDWIPAWGGPQEWQLAAPVIQRVIH
jgi:hypothetical protein